MTTFLVVCSRPQLSDFMDSFAMTVKRVACIALIAIAMNLFALVDSPLVAGQTPAPSVSEIESLVRSRQYDQALQMATEALKKQPANYRLWTLKGIILSIQGKTLDAQKAFE